MVEVGILEPHQPGPVFPAGMLEYEPAKRLSIRQIRQHRWVHVGLPLAGSPNGELAADAT